MIQVNNTSMNRLSLEMFKQSNNYVVILSKPLYKMLVDKLILIDYSAIQLNGSDRKYPLMLLQFNDEMAMDSFREVLMKISEEFFSKSNDITTELKFTRDVINPEILRDMNASIPMDQAQSIIEELKSNGHSSLLNKYGLGYLNYIPFGRYTTLGPRKSSGLTQGNFYTDGAGDCNLYMSEWLPEFVNLIPNEFPIDQFDFMDSIVESYNSENCRGFLSTIHESSDLQLLYGREVKDKNVVQDVIFSKGNLAWKFSKMMSLLIEYRTCMTSHDLQIYKPIYYQYIIDWIKMH